MQSIQLWVSYLRFQTKLLRCSWQSHYLNFLIAWQICVDETTGYTYYWNMVTNQVTWDMPAEYAAYEKMTQQYDTRSTGNAEYV